MNSKLKSFLTKKQYYYFLFLLILYFFSSFLEIFSISLIPVFISLIVERETFYQLIINLNLVQLELLLKLSTKQLLVLSGIVIVSIFIIKNLYMVFVYYLQNLFNYRIIVDKSKIIFSNYIYSDYSFFLNKNSSKLVKNLTQEVHVSVGYLNMILDLIKETLLFLLIFLTLFLTTPKKLFFISSVLLISVIIFYLLLKKSVKKKGEIHFKNRDRLFFILDQSFGFIKEIKVINNLTPFINKFEHYLNKTNFQVIIIEVLNKLPRLIFEFLAVSICLSIILLSYDLLGSKIIPLVSLYAVCLIRLIPSYSAISSIMINLQFYKPSFEMICGELKKKKIKKSNLNKKNKVGYKRNGIISFQNISFGYSSKKKVIKNLSLNFKANEAVGIIGPSGSGKTTLGDIFLGLYKPSKGKITFDKLNIHEPENNWNNLISYLPQEPFILDDNIINNITMGDLNNFNKENLDKALELSNCNEFVNKLQNRYNTNVGQRGIKLSGGQKKRIGIARAIYQNRPIILLDEATSNLDPENDKIVMNSINKLKKQKTILLITHKISNLKYMDKVIYINNGIIEKSGKPDLITKYILRKKILEFKNLSLD